MDEPTAALTGAESERLFGIVARLRARGCGVLYVSHRIDEVLRLADRIAVLRDGGTEATIARADATRADLIAAMTGRAEAETAAAAPAPAAARVALDGREPRRRRAEGRLASNCARARSSASPASPTAARTACSPR